MSINARTEIRMAPIIMQTRGSHSRVGTSLCSYGHVILPLEETHEPSRRIFARRYGEDMPMNCAL
jgi:hypothetical protein